MSGIGATAQSIRYPAAFSPSQIISLIGWVRLQASQQSGGEWTPSIVDILNAGSPIVQTDTDRRAAVGADTGGLPTMVWDGSDIHLWPQSPAFASTTKLGLIFWYKPATVSGVQRLYSVIAGVAGSATNRIQLYGNGSVLTCEIYTSGAVGRFGSTASGTLVAGAAHCIYLQYDSSRGGDANLAMFIGTTAKSLTYGNLGAGATLTTLPTVTGNALIGGGSDSDTPANPIANGGLYGANMLVFNDNLTAAELASVVAFEPLT